MTEAYEDGCVSLVRVRAQVMCRDEATGGWLALGGGGLANVCVGKRPGIPRGDGSTEHSAAHNIEYFIYGKRISDDTEVLSCTIKKDFQYNKVMPTFHHWVTEQKRFGLTFQTAADARAFDRGVRTAIQELLDGLGGAWPSLHAFTLNNLGPKDDDEENNIFECLNLPSESRSSSENSSCSRLKRRDDSQTPILTALTLPARSAETSLKQYGMANEEKTSEEELCPYVHLTAVHVYTYPQVSNISSEKSSPNTKPPLLSRDSGSLKKQAVCSYSVPPPLPDKKPTKGEAMPSRLKCRHCNEWYLESANRPGACRYAPDCCSACIDAVSCIKCAQCMLYHCMSDAEGDFMSQACACAPRDHACATRWIGLTLLSMVVPCLWCYLPLRCFHRAGRSARIAGGLHAPLQTR